MKRYLVMDIGCIECGEESSIVGLFERREDADKAMVDYIDDDTLWGKEEWNGQHSIDIFDIKTGKEVL